VLERTGNLSQSERIFSALAGAALTVLAAGRSPMWRVISALAGGALIARGVTGHCAVKSALRTRSSLAFRRADRAIDESLEETFPASDPPASRLPDDPPINAAAKWRAVHEAGG
jgi:uncharacterized membrane protein